MSKSHRKLDILNHEIRTPLTGILGMIHQLNSGPLTAQQKECLADIDIASTALLNAVAIFLKEAEVMIQTTQRYRYDNNRTDASTECFISGRQPNYPESTAMVARGVRV